MQQSILQLKVDDLIETHEEAHFDYHQRLKYWTIVHAHDFYELFLITEGTVYHIVNGQTQKLSKGDLVFIRPADYHSYEKAGDAEVELLNINFRPQIIRDVIAYLGQELYEERMLLSSMPPLVHLSTTEIKRLLDKYEQTAALTADNINRLQASVRHFLAEAFELFVPNDWHSDHPDAPAWLQHVQIEMRKKDNFIEGLDALYRLAKVSPEHISRTIRKHFNQTPTKWINELRMQHAAYLLKHSNYEVMAIAMECGFNNLNYFYKTFQNQYRLSPGKYRNLNRKAAIPQ